MTSNKGETVAKPISLQLYTVREAAAKDFFGVIREVARIGYKGVEFAGLHGKTPTETANLLKELGLKVSSSHVSLPTSENINQLADQEKILGNDLLVAGFGPDDFKTVDDCKRSGSRFQQASEVTQRAGLKLACHNHWWEFHQVDGRLAYDIMLEEAPDLQAEVDVYWVAYGGADPVKVVDQYKSRIPVLHIKDGPLEQNKPHLPVGSGKLDMPAIVGAADPDVLKWLIVELDSYDGDMMSAVRESYRYLTSSGLASGNAA
jgi:sugar phosphate isomerase/epimerase